jgi:flagellar hook-basal body complex protein FliE
MSVNMVNAANAYANAARAGAAPTMEARDAGEGSFASALKAAAQDTVGALRQAEQMGMKAAAKEADLLQVVTAVSNAEVQLQTVVAVRDRVISAYQDILRMPI